jgi:hypothetical protein
MAILGYDGAAMAKKPANFEVTCPCCHAVLKVDAASHQVIAHTPPPQAKTFADLDEAARALKDQDSRRESIFRQSVEAQKNQADLLEKKFQEAVRRAKETPDTGRPVRDIDLD